MERTANSNTERIAKEAGRQYLRECASLNPITTAVFVEEVLMGLERGDPGDCLIHNELYMAIACAVPTDVSDDEGTIGRWTAEVEDEYRFLSRRAGDWSPGGSDLDRVAR